jgi:hypothetical protein
MNEAIITFVTEERNSDFDYDKSIPEFLTVTKVYKVGFVDAVDFYTLMESLQGVSAIGAGVTSAYQIGA